MTRSQTQPDRPQNPLAESASLIALFTAYLYCARTAQVQGYLNAIQLDADILDQNVNQVLYGGFLVCSGPGFIAGGAIAFSFWVLRNFLSDAVAWFFRNNKKQKKDFYQNMRKLKVVAYFSVACLLLSFLAKFEQEGRLAGETILSDIETHKVDKLRHVVVKVDDQQHLLISLFCGARNCAAMDPSTKTIHYFPQSGHTQLTK